MPIEVGAEAHTLSISFKCSLKIQTTLFKQGSSLFPFDDAKIDTFYCVRKQFLQNVVFRAYFLTYIKNQVRFLPPKKLAHHLF